MRKITCLLFVLAIVSFSCSSSRKAASNSASSKSFPASVPKSTDDGLSYETAIVITETSETKGVNAEYEWIKNHYKDYTVKRQSLNMYSNKPYDIITITLAGNKDLDIYFDISNFFGKF